MTVLLANNVSTTLAAAIGTSDTTFNVVDGNRFPSPTTGQYFYATLVATNGAVEIVKVTSRISNAFGVVRAQESTQAQAFAAGSRIEMRVTAATVLDAVADGVAEFDADIAALDARLDVAEAELVSLDGRLDTAESDITSLEGRMTTAEGDITSLEAFDTALATSTGSTSVGFLQAGTGATLRTVQAKLRDFVSVKDFGAVGDGVADDTVALQASLDAVPTSGTLYIPFGGYRFTSGLVRTDPIRIISDGAELIPDIDAATDAITIGPVSGSQYNYELTGFQIVTASGTSNKCKDGLVVRKAQQAKVDVRVNAACAGYGLRMSGIVWANVRYLTGYTNTYFTSGYVRPQNGLFVDYDGVNQANAGRYWFNIELCGNKGLIIENQINGGQTVYSGSIGYCGGNMLEVTAVQGASFDNIYFESNVNYNIVLDQVNFCSMRNWKRGQNGAILTMTDCSFNVFEGGQHRGEADWTMDADCVGNKIDNIDLQGGVLTGSSGTYTRWGAGVQNTNLSGTPSFSPAGDDMVNYASNSNFEMFTADRPAGGWNKPAAITYTQTGTGKADTTRRVCRYAAKLSATGITSATFTPNNKAQLIDHVKRTRFCSVKLPVYFPNTTENVASTATFQFRVRIVSTAAGNTDYFAVVDKTKLDVWQDLYAGGIRVPSDITDIQFALFMGDAAQNPTVLYIADFTIVPSPTAVRDYWPEVGNSGSMVASSGLLAIGDGVSAPTTLVGYAQIYVDTADGDLKIKFGDGTVKTIVTDT